MDYSTLDRHTESLRRWTGSFIARISAWWSSGAETRSSPRRSAAGAVDSAPDPLASQRVVCRARPVSSAISLMMLGTVVWSPKTFQNLSCQMAKHHFLVLPRTPPIQYDLEAGCLKEDIAARGLY